MQKVTSWIQQIPPGLVSALVLLAGLGLFYWMGQRDQRIDDDLETWRQSTQAILKAGNAFRARIDSLEGSEREQRAIAQRLRGERDEARVEVARARAARDTARWEAAAADLRKLAPKLQLTVVSTNRFQTDSNGVRFLADLRAEAIGSRDIIAGLELAEVKADSTILAYEEAARVGLEVRDGLKGRVADLETQLGIGLEVTECKFLLFFSCPSRTTAFIVGGVTGIVSTALIVGVVK